MPELQAGVDWIWEQHQVPIHEMWAAPETCTHILKLFGTPLPPEQRRLATCRVSSVTETFDLSPVLSPGLVWLEHHGWQSGGRMTRPWRTWLYSPVHQRIVRYHQQVGDANYASRIALIGETA